MRPPRAQRVHGDRRLPFEAQLRPFHHRRDCCLRRPALSLRSFEHLLGHDEHHVRAVVEKDGLVAGQHRRVALVVQVHDAEELEKLGVAVHDRVDAALRGRDLHLAHTSFEHVSLLLLEPERALVELDHGRLRRARLVWHAPILRVFAAGLFVERLRDRAVGLRHELVLGELEQVEHAAEARERPRSWCARAEAKLAAHARRARARAREYVCLAAYRA